MLDGMNIEERVVRIFVSSTFQEFKAEREALVIDVFPRLREHFLPMGINVVGIDLRWGINGDVIESRGVIDPCLEMVKRCEPFFLGLVGERVGWVPTPKEIHESKLIPHVFPLEFTPDGLSITQIEFEAGVSVDESRYAAFFINPAATSMDHNELRDKVLSGPWQSETYASLERLCQLTYEFFDAAIAERFPIGRPSGWDLAWRRSIATLRGHLDRYVPGSSGVEEALGLLLKGRSLYLYGEKGIGKSAAMSYLVGQIHASGHSPSIFVHLCSVAGDTLESLFQSIVHWLISEFAINVQKSEAESDYEFAVRALHAIKATSPVYLFVDGVDQVRGRRDPSGLLLSLREVNDAVRVCVSGIDELQGDGYSTIRLEKPSGDQVLRMIDKYFHEYGKSLQRDSVTRATLASSRASANPLLFVGMLNEVRLQADYENLLETSKRVARIAALPELFLEIDARLRKLSLLYGVEEQSVTKALAMIATTHVGVTEDELMRVTGIVPLILFPLTDALGPYLTSVDGRLMFNHTTAVDSAMAVVDKSVLEEVRAEALREYERGSYGDERRSEMLWRLFDSTCSDQRKAEGLLEKRSLEALMSIEPDALIRYLTMLKEADELAALARTCDYAEELTVFLARSLCEAGHYRTCVELCEKAIGSQSNERVMRLLKARCLYRMGTAHSDESQDEYTRIVDEGAHDVITAEALFKRGIVLKSKGMPRDALADSLDAIRMYNELGVDSRDVAWCEMTAANALFQFGQQGWREYESSALRRTRLGAGERSTAYAWLLCYAWQRRLLLGEYDDARRMCDRALKTFGTVHGEGPEYAWASAIDAVLLAASGRYFEAKRANERSARINDAAYTGGGSKHAYSISSRVNEVVLDYMLGTPTARTSLVLAECMRVAEDAYGANHPYVANVLVNHALVGGIPEDQRVVELRRAVTIYEEAAGEWCPDALFARVCLLCLGVGDKSQLVSASSLMEKDVVWRILNGEPHPPFVSLRNNNSELVLLQMEGTDLGTLVGRLG